MSDIPEFLKNVKNEVQPLSELGASGLHHDALARLEALVQAQLEAERQVADAEAELATRKDALKRLSMEDIPNLLNQHGLSEIKLKSGKKVIVKEGLNVSITEEHETEFYKFLEARNEADIIKLQLAFPKMPQEKQKELFEFLNGYEYDYESKKGVHFKTMEAYFKRLLGIGDAERDAGIASGKYLRKEDIASFANTFVFFKTTIK